MSGESSALALSGAEAEKSPAPSWRSSAAMLVERHRNRLALGVLALGSLALLALLFSPLLGGTGESVENVSPTALLTEARVIPDVIDPFEAQAEIQLALGSRQLLDGVSLPLADAQQPPTVAIEPTPSASSRAEKYVLVMVDPDAPSPEDPTLAEWLHWMVSDIAPDMKFSVDSTSMKFVVPYAKPTPPQGTHRYVFVAFKQPADMAELTAPAERGRFNTREFAQKYSLGPPVAALYLTTEKPPMP